MKAYWTGEEGEEVVSPSDLSALIDAIRRTKRPTMVFLESASGASLAFGVGGKESCLTFINDRDESYHSLGDANRDDALEFWSRDEPDEFLGETAVPEPVALAAAFSFLADGKRPSNLEWEADW